MAFDLTTAKPVESKFDLSTAKPVEPPSAPTSASATAAPEQENTWRNAIKNVAQAAGHYATSITGGIAGQVAGLGALGYDITANAVMHPFSGAEPGHYADPDKVKREVSDYFTSKPDNPDSASMKIVQAPGQVVSGAGEFLGQQADKTGLPYVGSIARGIPEAVVDAMGAKAAMPAEMPVQFMGKKMSVPVPEKVPGTPEMPAVATPEQEAVRHATDAGYKLSPSQTGSKIGATMEGLSGQAASERLISTKNVPVTDAIARKSIGLPENARITPQSIQSLKDKAGQAYDAVAKTGARKTSDAYRADIENIVDRTGGGSFAADTPEAISKLKDVYAGIKQFDAKDAVAKIRQLRTSASKNIKAPNAPEQNALGYAQRKVAEALDDELARHVSDIGKPDLVKRYQAARVQLAKIYTVEDALKGTNVSAKSIWQQWKRGAPLDKDLLTIAKTYDSFQHVLQDASKVRQKHPFSVIDLMLGAGAALHSAPLAAAVLARPAARSFLASDTYQRLGIRPKGAASAPAAAPPTALAPIAATAITPREKIAAAMGR